MLKGWIKLHRKLIGSDVWIGTSPHHKVIAITILIEANHDQSTWEEEDGDREIVLNPGTFVTSYKSLADDAGVSKGAVRNALKKLQDKGFIEYNTDHGYTYIEVVNWDKYQSNGDESEPEKSDGQEEAAPTDEETSCDREDSGLANDRSEEVATNKPDYMKGDIDEPDIPDEDHQLAFQVWGHVPPVLARWYDWYDPSWIPLALKRTKDANKCRPSYTKAILEDWAKQGGPDESLMETAEQMEEDNSPNFPRPRKDDDEDVVDREKVSQFFAEVTGAVNED